MSEETAVAEFSDDTKVMGDKIAEMTLKQAKELSDYLKDVHGIEPAAGGGAMVMAAADDGSSAEEEKTEFDVVLTGFGDKKLNVVKVVKNLTGASLDGSQEDGRRGSCNSQRGCLQRRSRESQRRSRRSWLEASNSSSLSPIGD